MLTTVTALSALATSLVSLVAVLASYGVGTTSSRLRRQVARATEDVERLPDCTEAAVRRRYVDALTEAQLEHHAYSHPSLSAVTRPTLVWGAVGAAAMLALVAWTGQLGSTFFILLQLSFMPMAAAFVGMWFVLVNEIAKVRRDAAITDLRRMRMPLAERAASRLAAGADRLHRLTRLTVHVMVASAILAVVAGLVTSGKQLAMLAGLPAAGIASVVYVAAARLPWEGLHIPSGDEDDATLTSPVAAP